MTTTIAGPVDVSIRLLSCLGAFAGDGLTLPMLRRLDVLVPYATRIGGPTDVDVFSQGCLAARSFREPYVLTALGFLERLTVVRREGDVWRLDHDGGDPYDVSLDAPCDYVSEMDRSARWLAAEWRRQGEGEFVRRVEAAIEADAALGIGSPPDDGFAFLRRSYEADLRRFEGIFELARRLGTRETTSEEDEVLLHEQESLAAREYGRIRSELKGLVALLVETPRSTGQRPTA